MIPRYGYQGAAVVTVLSEFSLLFPFYYSVRRHVAPLPWLDLLWRQAAAAAVMGAAVFLLAGWSSWLAVASGWAIYAAVLLALGTFRDPDIQSIRRALPLGRPKAAPSVAAPAPGRDSG
jgi:O-antigen/teichoic acid export membrane protein